ncbi:malonate--CoA ligase ACSF3, mitochondrial-like [Bacillus rossius redtenbacheri]|uniref:malonate--CoA ligase ACSF3, mitochondrial-like n=1 Tax=Bacillus rossius redtenbacheri TaxID=93214 RepID=UPI002FDC949F
MSAGDCVLHVSPLHRLSGVVNELLCPLSVGATCVMLPKFDPAEVWSQLLYNKTINVLIATPNVYVTLIEEFEKSLADKKGKIRDLLSGKIRLMASGFGALPQCAWQRWQEITGHAVLQSYGRTETGTVMSGSLAGQRRLGCVGTPLPGVEVKLVGSDGCTLLHGNSEETRVLSGHPCRGVLQVRGPGLFTNYSNQPAAGSNSADGWFSTGDVVQYQNGMYKVLEVTDVNEEETACGK